MKKFEYFLVGAFTAFGALFLELTLDALFFESRIINLEIFLLVAFVVIEELAKLIAIWKKVDLLTSWRSVLQGCFWIGLGFGILELGILSLNKNAILLGNIFPLGAVLLVHITTTILTGAFLLKFKESEHLSVLAITPAILLHLAFNYWIFTR
jgi:hypothetical protein